MTELEITHCVNQSGDDGKHDEEQRQRAMTSVLCQCPAVYGVGAEHTSLRSKREGEVRSLRLSYRSAEVSRTPDLAVRMLPTDSIDYYPPAGGCSSSGFKCKLR